MLQMNYSLIINLKSERIGNDSYFFWYISENHSMFRSNSGFGWAVSIEAAVADAIEYCQKTVKSNLF